LKLEPDRRVMAWPAFVGIIDIAAAISHDPQAGLKES
jgi:hypothetical protein